MHADPDDIAALAFDPGGASHGVVRDHVRSCSSCQSLQVSLASVARGLRESADDGPLVAPPEDVRRRVLAAAMSDPGVSEPTSPLETTAEEPATVLPMRPARARLRGVPLWAAGLAAAVTLVAGLGIGRMTVDPETPAGPPVDVVASTDLTSLEGAEPRGLASAVRTGGADRAGDVVTLRIDADALGGQEGIHEVWLLNVDGTRLIAVGLLTAGDEGEFEVPESLLDAGYRIVDISVEPDDGDPTHSGVSLARGELV